MGLGLAAVGYGGWRAASAVGLTRDLAAAEALLAEGELQEAAVAVEALRAADPGRLEGHLLGARVLRALHDRPGTERVLGDAYALAPDGFPALPLYVDHRLRGPDDPAKGRAALAFLAEHLASHPADERAVTQGRLVALAYLLGQRSLAEDERAALRVQAEAALDAFEGASTTEEHYDRAQVLLALGRVDDAVAAGRAGIAAGTEPWVALVMHWAIATTLVHRGEADAAWAEMEAIHAFLAAWPGVHFGMGKPLAELMQLTAHVRYGRVLDAPAGHADRLARLDEEGVRLQLGDAETRDLLTALLAASRAGDTAEALTHTDDLLALVARDRGCEMENQLIRPHTEAMLLAARGDLLVQRGDLAGARASYAAAAEKFPGDAWLAAKRDGVPSDNAAPLTAR